LKYNSLVILFVFVGLSAFNISDTFEMSNPSVKIVSEETKITKAGDIIIYSVKLCSADNLKTFSIKPSVMGDNEDSYLEYIFDKNSKHATVNYYYVVPENYKDFENLTFQFILQDSKRKIVETKSLKII
jgi:hypothetical protein